MTIRVEVHTFGAVSERECPSFTAAAIAAWWHTNENDCLFFRAWDPETGEEWDRHKLRRIGQELADEED